MKPTDIVDPKVAAKLPSSPNTLPKIPTLSITAPKLKAKIVLTNFSGISALN
ncbi:hypothetical protein H6F96_03760 [Microcoleus sp. FACHB-53]|nr:hypothetical protein [Microcoleus sp. FACHB-53]